ncbi:MAG TPA: O-antigen ligase family protein [Blastocatellia bacterium]|nr:O-antigen ligase family protein [Blastocatellia bacterium]
MSLIAWLARDLSRRRFHFKRTPIDLPLLCFAVLTILSAVFSVEPGTSLPKLKTLLLFGVIYVVAANLSRSGVRLMTCLLIISGLVGVGFSLVEKLRGRGMTIAAIEAESPLAGSHLQPGDVIWMIGRHRVASVEEATREIRQYRDGEEVGIEALHAGDPVPVKIRVTDELKARTNPLGLSAGGRSRQFRVSGFSRQFQTYAEQMQILAMLAYGGLLTTLKFWQRRNMKLWSLAALLLFVLFSLALTLTASRAVIAASILSVVVISLSLGGRLALVLALSMATLIGGCGFYILTTARNQATVRFDDDSTTRRLAYMEAGVRLIPQYPLLGVGMDSHKRHWQEWKFPGEYITHTHSTPIQIAVDRGLPALACYLWLIAAMMIMAWRGFKDEQSSRDVFDRSLALGALGALLGFTISSLTNYNFGDSEVVLLLLSIAGLVTVSARKNLAAVQQLAVK